jgi:SAM-dependent methyltransferase
MTSAAPASETFANPEVLRFYRDLPFNYHSSAASQANMIRANDSVAAYPALLPLLRPGLDVFEVGCGAGWFSLSLRIHHRCRVSAIDFNPVVVERARELTRMLKQDARFEVADLFLHRLEAKADLVVSLGVLHHTDNCLRAIERLCTEFTKPEGHVFIGLYHRHGRRPFLDHFEAMKRAGASVEVMFAEYRRLHASLTDDTFAESWFRDQVLHPKETQHTLAEVAEVFTRCGVELVSTSINGFQSLEDPQSLFETEARLARQGEVALAAGEYYPGFFVVLGRKNANC